MRELQKQLDVDVEIEKAEFVNRLMIDAYLSEDDIKIGLCLLHDILLKMKNADSKIMRD